MRHTGASSSTLQFTRLPLILATLPNPHHHHPSMSFKEKKRMLSEFHYLVKLFKQQIQNSSTKKRNMAPPLSRI